MSLDLGRLRKQKYACTSILISLAELLLVWGVIAISIAIDYRSPHLARALAYVIRPATLGAFAFAIVGLFKDSERVLAVIALLFAFLAVGLAVLPVSP
jgi:hypothetical protein